MASPIDMSFYIHQAKTSQDLEDIRDLFTAYVEWLNLDLSFQDFQAELSSLPGKYAPPKGGLLLARSSRSEGPLGCVAFRALPALGETCCEMKRLYVVPDGRGSGVGVALARAVLEEARNRGFELMKLDTLADRMGSAVKLYKQLGFVECEKYYDTPLSTTLFLECDLSK